MNEHRYAMLRKFMSWACAVLLVAASARMLWVCLFIEATLGGTILSVVASALAVGLIKDKRIAIRVTSWILCLATLMLPVAMFMPIDGNIPFPLAEGMALLIPAECALFFCAHVLRRENNLLLSSDSGGHKNAARATEHV